MMRPVACMTIWLWGLLAAGICAADPPAATPALVVATPIPRVALVMGNAAYAHCPPLASPGNDAEAMTQALVQCGFGVIKATDCTAESQARYLEELRCRVMRGGAALFYYSGYAIKIDNYNYMVPVDADPPGKNEARDRCLPVDRVLGAMIQAGAGACIVVLDACRENPFMGRWPDTAQGLAKIKVGKGVLVAFAAAPGKTAGSAEVANAAYTECLVRSLVTPARKTQDVFKEAASATAGLTKRAQVPWMAGSVPSEFYFQPPPQTAAAKADKTYQTAQQQPKKPSMLRQMLGGMVGAGAGMATKGMGEAAPLAQVPVSAATGAVTGQKLASPGTQMMGQVLSTGTGMATGGMGEAAPLAQAPMTTMTGAVTQSAAGRQQSPTALAPTTVQTPQTQSGTIPTIVSTPGGQTVGTAPGTSEMVVVANVPGATIKVNGNEVGKADSTGMLMLKNVTPGHVTVEVAADTYESQRRDVQIKQGETLPIRVELVKIASASTMGTVVVALNPMVPGAALKLNGKDAGKVDATAMATLKDVPPGPINLEAAADGYKPKSVDAVVKAGETTALRIEMEQVLFAGKPARLLLTKVMPGMTIGVGGKEGKADAAGNVEIKDLPPGSTMLEMGLPDGRKLSVPVTLVEGDNSPSLHALLMPGGSPSNRPPPPPSPPTPVSPTPPVPASPSPHFKTGSRVALVIGNKSYANVGRLGTPVNDAKAIAEALQGCGFEVVEKTDCNYEALDAAISEFAQGIQRAEIALIYYSGHAVQIDGQNYLLPVDAKGEAVADLKDRSVDLTKTLADIEQAGAKVRIVILDACRKNRLTARAGTEGLAEMKPGKGTLIAYAAAPGKTVEDAGQTGLFTERLAVHLRTPGIDFESMFRRVSADVLRATHEQQTPWTASALTAEVRVAAAPGK